MVLYVQNKNFAYQINQFKEQLEYLKNEISLKQTEHNHKVLMKTLEFEEKSDFIKKKAEIEFLRYQELLKSFIIKKKINDERNSIELIILNKKSSGVKIENIKLKSQALKASEKILSNELLIKKHLFQCLPKHINRDLLKSSRELISISDYNYGLQNIVCLKGNSKLKDIESKFRCLKETIITLTMENHYIESQIQLEKNYFRDLIKSLTNSIETYQNQAEKLEESFFESFQKKQNFSKTSETLKLKNSKLKKNLEKVKKKNLKLKQKLSKLKSLHDKSNNK